MSQERIRWSQKSLSDLVAYFHGEIEPALRRAGHETGKPPTYQDLLETGNGGIQYALREHHDRTLREFFVEDVGLTEEDDTESSIPTDDEGVQEEIDAYLHALATRKDLAESTIRTRRYRLKTYVDLYLDYHGEASFVDAVQDESNRTAEIQRNLDVFDHMHQEFAASSCVKYHGAVSAFYEHLLRRSKAAFNPVRDFTDEYDWRVGEPDNPALSPAQVSRLVDAVETPAEEIVVYALCAWGLRRGEVASLHSSQLDLSGSEAVIHFDDGRKNGPGSVSVLYGRPILEDRVALLGERSHWNGYLLPSGAAASGHVTGQTVQNRFQRICERSDVRVRGETPVSKMGRRFWYSTYSAVVEDLVTGIEGVAADQGSADASVVLANYVSQEKQRELRRNAMRERLAAAFDGQNRDDAHSDHRI
ncbi:tyrosine-type recombinase/integrase [Haloarchaeobius sp. DFWS5]|uniref:tyrosine-type recombinase/integrase n=1 Tax=Haloarchaeobius sp. DFWS5 TaxID=3446114 RepID=UPI003EB75997